jgi:membrane-associated PAP2 superfamily phosphatase
VLVFVKTAHEGRPRLARNCLLIAAGIGMLGFASNMVG